MKNVLTTPKNVARFLAMLCLPVALLTAPTASAESKAVTSLEASGPRPVVSEIVTESIANQRRFTGLIEAQKEIDLAFQTSGNLLERPVDVGDTVKAGDLIASLNGVTLEDDEAVARAAVQTALINQSTARSALNRAQTLVRQNISSAASLEVLESAATTADAAVQQAEAALLRAQNNSSFARLLAPADGTIISVAEEAGAVITSGVKIATLATSDGRDAVVDVPEEYLEFLGKGDAFDISLRVGNLPPVTGRLRLIEPVADVSTRARTVRIELLDANMAFRLGSLVNVSKATSGAKSTTLPASAFFERDGQTYVWRVSPETREVERVAVTIQTSADQRRVVFEGEVQIGDEIITKGVNSLEAGQIVGARETR
ncbi:efflux RND transporter periplasmic adaptor subunit [Sulfitobacter sp.]|uniref:efflux RND transporter periplasmic adaptor subunit n=1 Tax=Sulfitobacter sp. TaxID=1903071 RepID=UPI003EF0D22C